MAPSRSTSGAAERAGATISGCVLCGGESRRMGRDKAGLVLDGLDGRTLLERACAVLEPLCGEVLLASGERERAGDRDCVLDEVPGAGPLAGITAALAAAQGELLCVLAVDMPGATSAHFERLLERVLAEDLDACWFRTRGLDEPLFAVYRRTCLEPARAALAAGRRRVVDFREHPGPSGRPLRLGALELTDGESACSRNLNTPEDVAREPRTGDEAPTDA